MQGSSGCIWGIEESPDPTLRSSPCTYTYVKLMVCAGHRVLASLLYRSVTPGDFSWNALPSDAYNMTRLIRFAIGEIKSGRFDSGSDAECDRVSVVVATTL
jgi:hypothetical protein